MVGLVVLVFASCAKPAPSGRVLEASSTTTAVVAAPAAGAPGAVPAVPDPATAAASAGALPACLTGEPVLVVAAPIRKGTSAIDAVEAGNFVVSYPGDKYRASTAVSGPGELTGVALYDLGVGTQVVKGQFTGGALASTGVAPPATGPCEQPPIGIYVARETLPKGQRVDVLAASKMIVAAELPASMHPTGAIDSLDEVSAKVLAVDVPPGAIIAVGMFVS